MNIEKLKQIYNHILLNVPEDNFDMSVYSSEFYFRTDECNSQGCIIGHSISLDIGNVMQNFLIINYEGKMRIAYYEWSCDFLEIDISKEKERLLWEFCFGQSWSRFVTYSAKSEALARLKFVINGFFNEEFLVKWIGMRRRFRFLVDYDYRECLIEEPFKLL